MSFSPYSFKQKIIAPVFLMIAAAGLAGESLIFDHLTMEDGLVNNSVSGIVQDHYGYLWFGTQNGLNRYDGKNFLIFDSDPFNSNSLPHNQIQTLYLDPADKNILWIGSYQGLSRMSLDSEEFFNFTSEPDRAAQSLSNGIVTAVVRDAEGYVWAGTMEGLNRIDPVTLEIRSYFHSESDTDSILHDTIRALEVDSRNRLWIGSYGGLDLYEPAGDRFLHYPSDADKDDSIRTPYVMAIKKGPGHKLWVGTWGGGVDLFDPDEGRVSSRLPLDDDIYLLYPESEGRLWIGAWGGGLYYWDEEGNSLSHHSPDNENRYKLNHGIIYSFLKDRSGLYWVGTNGGGINKANPRKKDFRFLYHEKGNDKTLPNDRIMSLLEDRAGRLWVGTYGSGLWRFPIGDSSSSVRIWMPDESGFGLSHKSVRALMEDSNGTLWVGSLGGLDRYNAETGDFLHIVLKEVGDGLSLEPIVYALEEDFDGSLWIGTYRFGVIHWSESEGILGNYISKSDDFPLSSNFVTSIFLDSFQTLWVGTNRGLNRLNRQTGRFEAFYHDIDDNRSLSSNYISTIMEDSLENLWIGTSGGGINLYDRRKKGFHSIMRKDGLISNDVKTILEDDRNRLWIATISGMNIMNVQTTEILTVDSSEGIIASAMDQGAVKGKDGALFFGSQEGVLRFDPLILHDNDLPPPLSFNDIQVMGEPIRFHEFLEEGKELVLPWDRNYLTFEFAALDFIAPEHNLYRYTMIGLDQDWVNSGNRNYASYSNLKPGRYIFSVQGSNNDGFWNTESLTFSFRIKSPPWQQKWFILLYAAIGILLFFLLSNVQANFLLRRKLRDVENSRMDLQLINSKLEELAWRDPLTGLANRRYFDFSIHNLWHLSVREKKNLAALMIDVDFFKAYNDCYGHRMGDEALKRTARIIKSIARRDTDTVCRYGGEEFSVLMFDTPLNEAYGLCESLLGKFKEAGIPHETSSAAPYLSISIGLAALVPHDGSSSESLIQAADKALYAAKGKGRNRIECYPFMVLEKDHNE